METIALIKSNKLFENSDVTDVDFSSVKGEPLNFKAGKIIYRPGAPSEFLYLLIEGSVVLVSAGNKKYVGENEFFGSEILNDEKRKGSAVCEDDAFIIAINKDELNSLIAQDAGIEKTIKDFCAASNADENADETQDEKERECEPCPPCPEVEEEDNDCEENKIIFNYEEVAKKIKEAIYEPAREALNVLKELEDKSPEEKLLDLEKYVRKIYEKGNISNLFLSEFENPNMKLLNVLDLIKEFTEQFKIDFPYYGCEISITEDETYTVNVDHKLFYEAAKQILLNACEATDFQGEINIQISKDAEFVEIQFSDNGPGIRPENALLIFDPFVSIEKEGGLGLGLTVADKIIRAQGGKITAKHPEGGGGVISIFLPIVNESE